MVGLKGMAMGAADIVPGVSGGTIAFISGIYQELLDSLKKLTPMALPILWRDGPAAFWAYINGTFLVVLGVCILLSMKLLAGVISELMLTSPIQLWSFFFGLVLASIVFITRQIDSWSWREYLGLALGTAIALIISILRPAQLSAEPMMLFMAGAVAICAMILPGISGSFMLLMMGLYSAVIQALKTLDWVLLGSFFTGCLLGLLLFSHFLSWLLKTYHNSTLALLSGFLIGSLNVIWPWKYTLESFINRHGEEVPLVQENLMPSMFVQMTQQESFVVPALLLMLIGILLVLGIERLAKSKVGHILSE